MQTEQSDSESSLNRLARLRKALRQPCRSRRQMDRVIKEINELEVEFVAERCSERAAYKRAKLEARVNQLAAAVGELALGALISDAELLTDDEAPVLLLRDLAGLSSEHMRSLQTLIKHAYAELPEDG